MLVPNRYGSVDTYRYGFNGKEKDDEVKGEGNSLDYEKRFYDPRIGRFLSVDPLEKQFPWYTPYQFAGNTPIQAIDLDGAEEYHYTRIKDDSGKTIRLQLTHVEDIYEWQWKPKKDEDSFLGFQLWEEVKNPKKVYIVHETQNLPIAGRFSVKWQEYDCTATFENFEQAKNVKTNDFIPPQSFFLQVGIEAGADSMRDGAVPGKGSRGGQYASKTNKKQSIKLKDNTPQIGTNFESFSISIKGGKININGRSVTNGKFDFVVDNAGNLKIGSGHHNLSNGASSVQAAGEIKIYKGKVTSITNSSGHYKPSSTEASNYSTILQNAGVDVKGANLKVYNTDGTLKTNTKL